MSQGYFRYFGSHPNNCEKCPEPYRRASKWRQRRGKTTWRNNRKQRKGTNIAPIRSVGALKDTKLVSDEGEQLMLSLLALIHSVLVERIHQITLCWRVHICVPNIDSIGATRRKAPNQLVYGGGPVVNDTTYLMVLSTSYEVATTNSFSSRDWLTAQQWLSHMSARDIWIGSWWMMVDIRKWMCQQPVYIGRPILTTTHLVAAMSCKHGVRCKLVS